MARAAAGGAALRRGRHHRRRGGDRRLLPDGLPAAGALRLPARRVVPRVGVEGEPSDSSREWIDAVGVVRRRLDGAAAPWPAPRDDHRRHRRVDAVLVPRQANVSDLSHGLQHRRRGDHDDRDRTRLHRARRAAGAGRFPRARPAAHRRHRHVLRGQHRPRRCGDCVVVRPHDLERMARGVPVERRQLHRRRDGRRGGRHRRAARRSLARDPDGRTGVRHVPHVSHVHRASRGSETARRRQPAPAPAGGRGARAGAPGRAREGSVPRNGVARAADAVECDAWLGRYAAQRKAR